MKKNSVNSISTNTEIRSNSPIEKKHNEESLFKRLVKKYIEILKTIKKQYKKLQKHNKDSNIINEGFYFIIKPVPKMNIEKFLRRVIEFTKIDEFILIHSLVLLDRIFKNGISLTKYNIHKLVFISIVSSQKFLDDNPYQNSYYAEVGGLSKKEFTKLELEFLSTINFNAYVNDEDFKLYANGILKQIA